MLKDEIGLKRISILKKFQCKKKIAIKNGG
jgi:hypothetical protein